MKSVKVKADVFRSKWNENFNRTTNKSDISVNKAEKNSNLQIHVFAKQKKQKLSISNVYGSFPFGKDCRIPTNWKQTIRLLFFRNFLGNASKAKISMITESKTCLSFVIRFLLSNGCHFSCKNCMIFFPDCNNWPEDSVYILTLFSRLSECMYLLPMFKPSRKSTCRKENCNCSWTKKNDAQQ